MNPNQIQAYDDSIQYCNQLLNLLEQEKDSIRGCFKGEPLRAYLAATEAAIHRTKMIRSVLESLQAMQQ